MTNQAYINKTIALAGVQQCLHQVQKIAWTGEYDDHDVDTCLASLFVLNPSNYADVYGSCQNLRTGLESLQMSFTEKRNKEAIERTRYMVSLMLLAKKVQASEQLLQQISTTLSLLEEAATDIENQREYICQRIAQLYQNAISNLTPRVIVYGKTELLSEPENAAIIRSLLFAGLRAIILWHQAGGGQINLLLGKAKYLQTIQQLLRVNS
jgi:high frequency lysogenization protein